MNENQIASLFRSTVDHFTFPPSSLPLKEYGSIR